MVFPLNKNAFMQVRGKKKPYIMAHRGNRVKCPENTLAAFSRAVEDGADIIETDLHLSKDGEFICIHDDTVDRTTNGTGPVVEMTLSQIKHLRAANGFRGFEKERVPELKEVMAVLPKDRVLALELKTDAFLNPSVCQRLGRMLAKANRLDRALAISFSFDRIQAVKAVVPDMATGWITLSQKHPRKGPDVLGPYWRLLVANPFYVFLAHLRNQAVCPLDDQPDSRLWLYKLLGCDAVITDDPETTAKKLGREGQA